MAFFLTMLGATLACGLEMLEALAIVLAVAVTRGLRNALVGALAAAGTCALLVLAFGPALIASSHVRAIKVVVGLALLVVGLNWLRKAVMRLAGRRAHSSAFNEFTAEREALRGLAPAMAGGPDWSARAIAFKGVLLEGVEVVVIVGALSAHPGGAVPAVAGAGIALFVAVAVGVMLHRPLRRVPETHLKYLVGIVLTAFGTYFLASGLGAGLPLGDGMLAALVAVNLLLSQLAATLLARVGRQSVGAAESDPRT